jgi:hypothetical protein
MKLTRRINDPYHNPFHNRNRFPVHARIDEMQAYTHMTWLNEPTALEPNREKNQPPLNWTGTLAPAFALVLLMIFSAMLLSH